MCVRGRVIKTCGLYLRGPRYIMYIIFQLQEQIMPILDLMATLSSPHFAKLKDFIHMQLPSGFPVKIGASKIAFIQIYVQVYYLKRPNLRKDDAREVMALSSRPIL